MFLKNTFQVFYQSLQLRALVSYSTRMDDVPEEYFPGILSIIAVEGSGIKFHKDG